MSTFNSIKSAHGPKDVIFMAKTVVDSTDISIHGQIIKEGNKPQQEAYIALTINDIQGVFECRLPIEGLFKVKINTIDNYLYASLPTHELHIKAESEGLVIDCWDNSDPDCPCCIGTDSIGLEDIFIPA